MIRRTLTTVVFVALIAVLGAVPASARPGEPIGPTKVVCTVKLFWPISQQICFAVPR